MLLSTYYFFLSTFIYAISCIFVAKIICYILKLMYYEECYKNSHLYYARSLQNTILYRTVKVFLIGYYINLICVEKDKNHLCYIRII